MRREGDDAISHAGDAIGNGPVAAECLELMMCTSGVHLIYSNHYVWFREDSNVPHGDQATEFRYASRPPVGASLVGALQILRGRKLAKHPKDGT